MVRAVAGEFDAVVAMYHDQGHIALKLLGMYRAVNITLGLPIVRTVWPMARPHKAWTGQANPTGMVESLKVAAQLVRRAGQLGLDLVASVGTWTTAGSTFFWDEL